MRRQRNELGRPAAGNVIPKCPNLCQGFLRLDRAAALRGVAQRLYEGDGVDEERCALDSGELGEVTG
jgi:hypothetical protein